VGTLGGGVNKFPSSGERKREGGRALLCAFRKSGERKSEFISKKGGKWSPGQLSNRGKRSTEGKEGGVVEDLARKKGGGGEKGCVSVSVKLLD